jgi:hypothetical protein
MKEKEIKLIIGISAVCGLTSGAILIAHQTSLNIDLVVAVVMALWTSSFVAIFASLPYRFTLERHEQKLQIWSAIGVLLVPIELMIFQWLSIKNRSTTLQVWNDLTPMITYVVIGIVFSLLCGYMLKKIQQKRIVVVE